MGSESEPGVTRRGVDFHRRVTPVVVVYAAALAKQLLVWFVLYRVAGYNEISLAAAQAATFALGVGFVVVYRLGWRRIGLGPMRLLNATAAVAVAYGAVALTIAAMGAFGRDVRFLRTTYSVYALFNNWILTGLAEELLFAGVLFTVVRAARDRTAAVGGDSRTRGSVGSIRRELPTVLIVAALFSVWHLPGYLAVAARTGGIGIGVLVDLAVPAASWFFFGLIYAASGNLWLTAFVHASTDYALLPAIVERPVVGLLFMVVSVALAAWLGRRAGGWAARVARRVGPCAHPYAGSRGGRE